MENKYSDIKDKINNVKPIWRILSVNSKIKYFSLGKGDSVLDNVSYYSLIVDCNHQIKSINKLDNVAKLKDRYQPEGNEVIDFYFSDNAVVESEKEYDIKTSPMFEEGNTATFESVETYGEEEVCQVTIISAETIYGDVTYFFEGDDLSGGLTSTNKRYEPYSGNWDSTSDDKINRAKNYLDEIKKQKGNNIYTTPETTQRDPPPTST